jgi:hypothetical protein
MTKKTRGQESPIQARRREFTEEFRREAVKKALAIFGRNE